MGKLLAGAANLVVAAEDRNLIRKSQVRILPGSFHKL